MDSLYFGGSGAMEILQIEEIAESDKLQEQAKPALCQKRRMILKMANYLQQQKHHAETMPDRQLGTNTT